MNASLAARAAIVQRDRRPSSCFLGPAGSRVPAMSGKEHRRGALSIFPASHEETSMSSSTENATGWRPKPGDVVSGTISDLVVIHGDYDPYPCVEVQTADGALVAVHAFHTVLQRELARRKFKVGDEIEVRYVGEVVKGSGKNELRYHGYKVKGGGTSFNWSAFDPNAEPIGSDIPSDHDLPFKASGDDAPPY
jgi:hypothetical protein